MASTSSSNEENDTLIFAHVLFRHGARNIVAPYPNDPYKDEIHWPEGFGQLTNVGKQQLYRLGLYLRRRYDNLIDKKYSYKDIHVQSTDFCRTIMSAQACLAGLYRPAEEDKLAEDINWQPIPVHTIPTHLDHVLVTGKKCPRFQRAHVDYLQNTSMMKDVLSEYKQLFAHWSKHSGMNIQSIDAVNLLYNTLCIEQEQNKPLPAWAERALKPDSPMNYIANLYFQSYAATPELARLKQGFLIKEIMDRFSQKIHSTLEPDRKLWLYSAHDLTIVNVLNSLGLFGLFEFDLNQPHFPPYGASLHFELFRTSRGEHYFKIFYRNAEEEYPDPISIPGCGERCSLKQFYDLYSQIIPGDFEMECWLPA
ncbi:hypothetical protein HA402_004037 [Bradysia odoriphaga]|nr:hypothetical protein HA402_004037 [Bradysia odoriphaga]